MTTADDAAYHSKLGAVFLGAGDVAQAAACFRLAALAAPGEAAAHNNWGSALVQAGQPGEALDRFDAALALQPDYAQAHVNRGMALLSLGVMPQGWAEYEWRWRLPGWNRRSDAPQWRGEPAAGKTLLLHAEQGFGDTIQFSRYAVLAAAMGMRVMIEAPGPLVRLLRILPGSPAVMAPGEAPPHDLQCPMLSMPLAFGTVLAAVPRSTCYLRADGDKWRAALAGPGVLAGLVWAGTSALGGPGSPGLDRRRSVPPRALLPLAALPGVRWVSLQKDGRPPFPMIDVMDGMRDFADTAALVAALDVVVSVDTAVAHLAAALGKPVLLMDRAGPCWRWLTGRVDSPWYPTLRIVRQPSPGDWPAVIDDVAAQLGQVKPAA